VLRQEHPLRTSAHLLSSATVTKVNHTRAPVTCRWTQAGARFFCSTEATSVSMTTSATDDQASDAFREARRSARKGVSSSSDAQISSASSCESLTTEAF
jgi:hypothetical protein